MKTPSERRICVIALFAMFCISPLANSATITFDVINVSRNTWQYDYTIENESLASGISEFRIFFELGLFADLEVLASPSEWDSIVADPDPELPDDGFLDALTLAGPLTLGDSLSGFQVRFTWLGTGTPGPQLFSVLDPETFESLFDGRTRSATSVPEPGTLGLLGIWLAAMAGSIRCRGRKKSSSEA